jgi:hypothetical protein
MEPFVHRRFRVVSSSTLFQFNGSKGNFIWDVGLRRRQIFY